MNVISTLTAIAFTLSCAASSFAFANSASCTDFSGSFIQTDGTTSETIVLTQTGCDSITVGLADGSTELLPTRGVAATIQTAANGRTLEYIGYFADRGSVIGAAARFHFYATDAVGVMSESQMMTLSLDASTNLVLSNSALSSTSAAQSATEILVRTSSSSAPHAILAAPVSSKLRAIFKNFAH